MTKVYSEAEKHKISSKLYDLGVYNDAQDTTLTLEGEEALHEDALCCVDGYSTLLIYPKSADIKAEFMANVGRSYLLYQLFVKEVHLSRYKTFYTPTRFISHAMNEDKTWVGSSVKLPAEDIQYLKRTVMVIEDFYDSYDFVMTKQDRVEQDTMERYLQHRMYNKNTLLVLYCDMHPDKFSDYWSKKFINILKSKAKIIEVSA